MLPLHYNARFPCTAGLSMRSPLRTVQLLKAIGLEFYTRLVGYITGITVLVAAVACGEIQPHYLWITGLLLLFPVFQALLQQRFQEHHLEEIRQINQACDAFNLGFFGIFMGMPLIGLLCMLAMLVQTSYLYRGFYGVTFNLLLVPGGAVAGYLLPGGHPIIGPTLYLETLAISGLLIHCMLYLNAYRHQTVRLANERLESKRQRQRYARLAHNLSKYVSPQVWEQIFSGRKHVRLENQRKKLTVFFSDIKGFTDMSEQLEAEALTELLNNYLTEMSKIALKYGGTIDKFIGDSIMVFFGDPKSRGVKEDAVAAVSMAIEMRKYMKVLRQQWRSKGIRTPLEIRMGISTGYVTVGNFGAENRMDYTIIGREVNLASRLESSADSGEILVSYETYSHIKELIMCRDKGEIQVKGFSRAIRIFQVVDFRRDLGARRSFIEQELEGFSMYLDIANIQAYDKQRVIRSLEQAANKLRDEVII